MSMMPSGLPDFNPLHELDRRWRADCARWARWHRRLWWKNFFKMVGLVLFGPCLFVLGIYLFVAGLLELMSR